MTSVGRTSPTREQASKPAATTPHPAKFHNTHAHLLPLLYKHLNPRRLIHPSHLPVTPPSPPTPSPATMAAADTINGSVQSAAGVPHETRHPHQHEEYTDDGQTFTISLVNSERLAGKDQISTSIPGAGLISELEIAEVDERPPKLQVNGGAAPASPEPESPTASPTRRHSHTLPAEYDGGEESDIPPGADEGADGRGPGGHEADLRHVPVDGGAGGVSHARRRGPTTPTRTHASLSDHAHDGSPRRNRALEDVTTSPRNHHAMHPSERGHENPNGVIVLDSPIIEDDIAHVPQVSRLGRITPPLVLLFTSTYQADPAFTALTPTTSNELEQPGQGNHAASARYRHAAQQRQAT